MTRVEIWNYKTIEHVSFEFEGYTLVLGKNFIGKSAIIAAIVSALTNRSGDSFIRYGEKFCQVLIQRDGHSVLWHKEKGDSYYIIDEVPYRKIGKADVPQAIKDMGFGPLEVSGEKILLWFAKQFEPLFLVNRPRQNFTTDLIASVSNLDPLYKGVDAAKKDSKTNKSELNIRRADLSDAKEEYKKFDNLDKLESVKGKADTTLELLKSLDKEIEVLTQLIQKLETNKEELVRTFPVTKMVDIDVSKYTGVYNEVNKATSLLTKYNKAAEVYKALAIIQQHKGIPSGLATKIQDILSLTERVSSLQALYTESVETYIKLKPIDGLKSLTPKVYLIEQLNDEILKVSQLLLRYEESIKQMQALASVEKFKEHPDLSLQTKVVDTYSSLVERYNSANAEYGAADQELRLITEESIKIEKEKLTFDKCPTCERSFSEH